jgi:hypothetical protein
MILMIDAALLTLAAEDDHLRYLLELATIEPVEAHLYAFDSSLPNLAPSIAVETGITAYKQWVVVQPIEGQPRHEAAFFRGGVPQVSPMLTNDSVFRQIVEQGPLAATESTALLTAKALRADILVTRRSFSVDPDREYWRNTLVLSPTDALPIVGLYLRNQNQYVFGHSAPIGQTQFNAQTQRRDRSWFYWEAARTIVPVGPDWSNALRTYASETGNEEVRKLPDSITWRLNQVLRSRDRLMALLAVVPQEHAPVDDILIEVDQLLLLFMATLDITARIAHIALEIPSNVKDAGWQKHKWLKRVIREDSSLALIFAESSEGRHVLDIIGALRNTIHASAFSANGMIPVVGDQALQPLVPLPATSRTTLLAIFEEFGGLASWGVIRPFRESDYHLRPGDFIERLFKELLLVLNRLITIIPVERLIDGQFKRPYPPRPRTLSEQRALWQLGFNLP